MQEEKLVVVHQNYVIRLEFMRGEAVPSITCTTCHRRSYNDNDIREKYCSFCHVFHEDRV